MRRTRLRHRLIWGGAFLATMAALCAVSLLWWATVGNPTAVYLSFITGLCTGPIFAVIGMKFVS